MRMYTMYVILVPQLHLYMSFTFNRTTMTCFCLPLYQCDEPSVVDACVVRARGMPEPMAAWLSPKAKLPGGDDAEGPSRAKKASQIIQNVNIGVGGCGQKTNAVRHIKLWLLRSWSASANAMFWHRSGVQSVSRAGVERCGRPVRLHAGP